MRRVLVTGSNGFIGHALIRKMLSENWPVRGIVRAMSYNIEPLTGLDLLPIESVGPNTDWSEPLIGVDCVVHLAARVHIMNNNTHSPLKLYRETNVAGTEHLAREAAFAKVRRFIYMSSVKVNGEGRSTPYNEEDLQKPQDDYSISKWEAEKILRIIAEETGMEIVILRSPLVYGPNVKANFLRLLKVVDQGIPLPLASVKNQRSLIYLENLVDAIVTCISHPGASGNTYFVSDGEDISTPDLIRKIASALKKPVRLFPFPKFLMFIMGKIIGKGPAVDRLTGSLTVDISKIRSELGWKPPFTMEHGLQKTAEWYKEKIK